MLPLYIKEQNYLEVSKCLSFAIVMQIIFPYQ